MSEQTKIWTKEEIKANLAVSNKWVCNAVVAIYNLQTEDEKAVGTTSHQNGVGFNGADAEIMTSFAKFIKQHGKLVGGQIPLAKKKILKYSKQLAMIANKEIRV